MSNPSSVTPLPKDAGNVTNLLSDWRDGDPSALDRLTPIIYDDLLRLARVRLSREFGEEVSELAEILLEEELSEKEYVTRTCWISACPAPVRRERSDIEFISSKEGRRPCWGSDAFLRRRWSGKGDDCL